MATALNFTEVISDQKRYQYFSEQWIVTYRIQQEGGTWVKKKSDLYYTLNKGKGAQNAVRQRFKRDYPGADIISVVCQ